MSENFSWYESAKEYDKLYRSIYGLPDPEPEVIAEPTVEAKPIPALEPIQKSV
jgi:starch synthase